MPKNEKKLTQEEIDRKISDIKAVWGIEGMEVEPETEIGLRRYFSGEITEDELMSQIIGNYKNSDRQICLARLKSISLYFRYGMTLSV